MDECKHNKTHVTCTIRSKDDKIIQRRYRKCKECGVSVPTVEIRLGDYVIMREIDGN